MPVVKGYKNERFVDVRHSRAVCRFIMAARGSVRSFERREVMNGSELVGLVLSLALLAYLTVALLKPEWFA
jgi:K+-transporting ATPase KdpF subunit